MLAAGRRALRKVVQKHRHHAARRRSPPLPLLPADAACDPASGPLERALRNERTAQLAAALQQLSIPQQRLVEWVHFEGLGHAEVAARLGCSIAASKMRLSRALAELSRHLEGE